MRERCCSNIPNSITDQFEFIKLERTQSKCALCEDFAAMKMAEKTPVAILSCEGACLRGEVSRQTANELCFSKYPNTTSRICLGGAFTKDTGQRSLVRKSNRVIALEGCSIMCASRMMKGVISDIDVEVVLVDQHYEFDTSLFAINEVSESEIKSYSKKAADSISECLNIHKS